MIVLIVVMKWRRATEVTGPTMNNAILLVCRELAAEGLRETISKYSTLERSHRNWSSIQKHIARSRKMRRSSSLSVKSPGAHGEPRSQSSTTKAESDRSQGELGTTVTRIDQLATVTIQTARMGMSNGQINALW